MKLKICALLITVIATTAQAQNAGSNARQTTVHNSDGTNTVTMLNEKGGVIQQAILKADGSVNRRTVIQYDQAGHCISWKSSNAHGTVDSGQHYAYDESAKGVLLGMRALDGSVLYQK